MKDLVQYEQGSFFALKEINDFGIEDIVYTQKQSLTITLYGKAF